MAKGTCSVDGCDRRTAGRGYCQMHYRRVRAHGSPEQWWPRPISVRFEENVQRTDTCWLWTGDRNRAGYGRMVYQRRQWLAHRLSYFLHVGPIPEGLHVLHHCDNPPCVNPAHLRVGTDADNVADMLARGRANGGAPHGNRNQAKLTEDQVREIKAALAAGTGHPALAGRYGVSRAAISQIARGKNWASV